MADLYTFGEPAVRELQQSLNQLRTELHILKSSQMHENNGSPKATFYIGKANGTIPAIDGDDLGEGYVDIYRPDGANIGSAVIEQFEVLNPAGEVANGRVVGIQQGAWGKWYVTVEACPG